MHFIKSFNSGDTLSIMSKFGEGYVFIVSAYIIGLSVKGYGDYPITISYTIMPSAQISDEKEYARPSNRSGDMYPIVPTWVYVVFNSAC